MFEFEIGKNVFAGNVIWSCGNWGGGGEETWMRGESSTFQELLSDHCWWATLIDYESYLNIMTKACECLIKINIVCDYRFQLKIRLKYYKFIQMKIRQFRE